MTTNTQPYNFTITLREGEWEVKIDPHRDYGYFEHDEQGEGGGLWFSRRDDGDGVANAGSMVLEDFDGRYVLPVGVAIALRRFGVAVDESFD